jgi:23S rRNA (uridine2552-2'-O)-methyltransferase
MTRGKGTDRRRGPRRRTGKAGAGSAPDERKGPKKPRKKRTLSSQRWLERHLSDPYVAEARRQGYRSRAAFKLIELEERYRLLKAGMRVVDLGAAPGGWTEVAVKRVRAGTANGGNVLAVDKAPMDPIPGARIIMGDCLDEAVVERVKEELNGLADLVLSDMAPATIGHAGADHLRIMTLAEAAFAFARAVLAPGGAFVCKVFQGGAEATLLHEIKKCFAGVHHAKPPASRPESAETYLVATNFRGGAKG